MAYFIVERNYAEAVAVPLDAAPDIVLINDDADVHWLYSFLSVDRRRSYCLYEASSAEAILTAAARSGMPADVITEVDGRMLPNGMLAAVG